MRALVQRVARAQVEVEGAVSGAIERGLLVFLGVSEPDSGEEIPVMARKIAKLRIFSDEAGKMNLSVQDIGGAALVVSQFTLYADTRRGNRPSFTTAAPPERAERLYQQFMEALRDVGVPTEAGVFAADMKVSLLNDGPVTIWLDSADF